MGKERVEGVFVGKAQEGNARINMGHQSGRRERKKHERLRLHHPVVSNDEDHLRLNIHSPSSSVTGRVEALPTTNSSGSQVIDTSLSSPPPRGPSRRYRGRRGTDAFNFSRGGRRSRRVVELSSPSPSPSSSSLSPSPLSTPSDSSFFPTPPPEYQYSPLSSPPPPPLPPSSSSSSSSGFSSRMRSNRRYNPSFRGRGRPPLVAPPKLAQQALPQLAASIIPPWRLWDTLAVNLTNVPVEANTLVLWRAFQKEGLIFSIDLFEDSHGKRENRGKIRFKFVSFVHSLWHYQWLINCLFVGHRLRTTSGKTVYTQSLCQIIALRGFRSVLIRNARILRSQAPSKTMCPIQRKSYVVPTSDVNPEICGTNVVKRIPIRTMDIGVLVNETTVLPMRTVGAGIDEHASLVLGLKHRAMFVYFQLPIFNSRQRPIETTGIYQDYRLKIPFAQMTKIFQTSGSASEGVSHLTFLDAPPVYHRRIKNIASTFTDENSWREADTWFRQTDIVHNPQELASLPISLRKFKPLIDIGE